MPRGKPLSAEIIAEIALRQFCGEPPKSIAKVMGIGYELARWNRQKRKEYAAMWHRKNFARQKEKLHQRYLDKFTYDPAKRWLARLARYGLTQETYDALLLAQDGRCAICGRQDSGTALHGKLGVDHNHATGVARGLLCQPCNAGLGGFKDNPAFLATAISYLAKWGIT